ncbi:MAG: NAD-dependent epimerase/dehydratase family protein [Hyphomicrobiaceae bacterium]
MIPNPPAHAGIQRVLVTGATGFLGEAVAAALERAGHPVLRGGRAAPSSSTMGKAWVGYGDIGPATRWESALEGVATVVHVAGLAHLPDASAPRAADALVHVNVEGTACLAAAAVRAGVRRFVLVSSALVHGEASPGRPFTETDPPAPQSRYARSKLGAEQRLIEIARGTGMHWVILRPPMVYGARARGNFRRLVRLVRSGAPLPLGAATAPRSFIGIDNLADAVVRAVEHARAADGTFLLGDGESTSTADLVRRIAAALGRRVWLLHAPPALLQAASRLARRERDYRRLFEPLELDITRIRTELDWSPPLSMDAGLAAAVSRPDS